MKKSTVATDKNGAINHARVVNYYSKSKTRFPRFFSRARAHELQQSLLWAKKQIIAFEKILGDNPTFSSAQSNGTQGEALVSEQAN